MKAITSVLLVLVSVLAIHFALGASSPDRPAGVDARNWVPVSETLGFVMTSSQTIAPAFDNQPLLLTPATEGYFMIRTSIGWQRLVIKDPLKGPGSSG
jgi:hypothetical protein